MTMSMNTYDGPYPAGVPNPFGIRVHAYPTRYHGPVYTRPMYALPWSDRPYDFGVPAGTAGLGQDPTVPPGAKPTEPKTAVECNQIYPAPASVESPDDFAAYVQNEACHERVKQAKDGRRWLMGVGVAFIAGFIIGRKA